MGGEEQESQGRAALDRWKYPVAALIVATFLGLVVYLTVRNGQLPYEIAVPLLGAALWALYNYRASGQE